MEARRAAHRAPTAAQTRALERLEQKTSDQGKCVGEVVEVINLPEFDAVANDLAGVEVPSVVVSQLRDYIETVARSYKINPFVSSVAFLFSCRLQHFAPRQS